MRQVALSLSLIALLLSAEIHAATATVTSKPLPGAHLQASIRTAPINLPPQPDASTKVQPGTAVKLSVVIKNIGDKSNHSGDVFVRFAFLKPLEGEKHSVLFETEKNRCPPLNRASNWKSFFLRFINGLPYSTMCAKTGICASTKQ